MWGHPRGNGTRSTGRIESKITRSRHKSFGEGGRTFLGHRGEMECLDCGHAWFSTGSPHSVRCSKFDGPCTHKTIESEPDGPDEDVVGDHETAIL